MAKREAGVAELSKTWDDELLNSGHSWSVCALFLEGQCMVGFLVLSPGKLGQREASRWVSSLERQNLQPQKVPERLLLPSLLTLPPTSG